MSDQRRANTAKGRDLKWELFDLVSLVVMSGFLVSLISSVWFIYQNQYVESGLYVLAAHSLRESIVIGGVNGLWVGVSLFSFQRFLSERRLGLTPLKTAWMVSTLAALWAPLQWASLRLAPVFGLLELQWAKQTRLFAFIYTLLEAPSAVLLLVLLSMALWAVFGRPSEIKRGGVRLRPSARACLVLALGALCGLIVLAPTSHRPAKRTNLILVVVDTLRADHLGLYGYDRLTSTQLERFAQDAVVFEEAFAPAPWTAPSMFSVNTGYYPGRFGVTDVPNVLPPSAHTLAEVLRNEGYFTWGETANLFASDLVGLDQGFDYYSRDLAGDEFFISSDALTDRALGFLSRSPQSPWFLYAHYMDPHFGYRQHRSFDFDAEYRGPIFDGIPNVLLREMSPTMTAADIGHVAALYDSEIAFTDQQLGRLFDGLRERGLYDDALIVVIADHGEEFSERGDFYIGHTQTLWQELLHVPFMIKYPGNRSGGTRESTPVSLIDVAPTLLAQAGLAFPLQVSGESLLNEVPVGRSLFSETLRYATLRAVREGRFKLIHDVEGGRSSLFDLGSDPGERVDLAGDMPKRVEAMEGRLSAWAEEIWAGRVQTQQAVFSADQSEMLKALGYTE